VERVALVTGTSGAIAEAISAELARSGFAVRVVSVSPCGGPPLGIEPRADAVIHVGLRTPRHLDEELRAEIESAAATRAADLACAAGARRLVHVSTTGVYGRPRNLPCHESELKAPRTAGERVRWRAEQASWAAFRRGAPLAVLRPTLLYGPTLRGGPLRALSLVTLLSRRRRVPIVRRGPVAHLLHLEDLARAVVHVVRHDDDRAVVGRAFNVGDEAPLALAEHLAAALSALGYEPGRILPAFPRTTGALLWLLRHVPDGALLEPLNRRLWRAWRRLAERAEISADLAPGVSRESLHWMSADHYYDTSRLASIGWRAAHPISTAALGETIRSLVAARMLPGSGARALPFR
jgi:nucleoside-diphosphate-sugar epimerase